MKNTHRSLAIAAAALLGLIAAAIYVRQIMIREHPQLPVDFVHADHVSVGCVDCHHNFVDGTGQRSCFDCHKNDAAIAADMQRMFHDLCRGCHAEKASAGEDAGPARVCDQCHRPNDAFM